MTTSVKTLLINFMKPLPINHIKQPLNRPTDTILTSMVVSRLILPLIKVLVSYKQPVVIPITTVTTVLIQGANGTLTTTSAGFLPTTTPLQPFQIM